MNVLLFILIYCLIAGIVIALFKNTIYDDRDHVNAVMFGLFFPITIPISVGHFIGYIIKFIIKGDK